ncbi:arabinose metabolism transcriptional repressor [Vallitalea longa]|uniref:Arabinose metabolism transcriptional repressor n=1 Tax=Vallitalea longa TaxID=2936439 RepID=A0A9W5YEI8_9FIRM|nr:substrate-binding domain-containing protein [Vallitalea longa]GKX31604.1 arabinose metabolism transcriptional repressor [Vallitalea longa]
MDVQPKYKTLKNYVLKHIQDGTYKTKETIPSENELCKLFDTSRVTVRKAIDELVHENYLYRVQGVGTFVQDFSYHKQDTTNRVDLIFHDNNFLFSEFNSNIILGVEKVLSQAGLNIATYYSMNNADSQYDKINNAINEGAKAIILCGCLEEEKNTKLKEFVNCPIPIVCIDRYFETLPFDAVIGEDFDAGYEAGKTFIEHGCNNIGYYYPYSIESSVTKGRLNGLLQSMKDNDIVINENLVISHTNTKKENVYDYNAISNNIHNYLLNNKDLQGILVFNDITALLFYKEAARLGIRIPEDIELISFGNFYIDSIFEVGLTSFNQHVDKMGEEAAKIIINRLINKDDRRKIVKIKYELVRRKSC